MAHLGFYGIIKLTLQIVLRNLKHFLCIAFLLALPQALAFIFVPSSQCIRTLLASISSMHNASTASHHFTAEDEALVIFAQQQRHQYSLPLFIILYIVSAIISLLCTLLVTFSVCRACMNKSLDLKGALRGVRRSAVNLLVTVLALAGVIMAVAVVGMVGMIIVAAVLEAMNAKGVVGAMAIAMQILLMAVVVYMAVVFGLATTVAIVEEKKGWEAMRRSVYLMRGNKWVAMGLYCFYGMLAIATLFVCASEDAFVVWRWVEGGIGVGLRAVIGLCSAVSSVVLYTSCKSGHAEPLDTLLPASAKFGPHELDPKYMDPETAAFTTASP